MPSVLQRPPFYSEFDLQLISGHRDRELGQGAWVESLRSEPAERTPDEAIAGRPIHHQEFEISGNGTGPLLSVFRRDELTETPLPCVFLFHGGGRVSGTRFSDLALFLDWVITFPVALASLEYGLTPENPGASPANDCHGGLKWSASNAAGLNGDPTDW